MGSTELITMGRGILVELGELNEIEVPIWALSVIIVRV